MCSNLVINLSKFTLKKQHPNTIFFTATCPPNINREFILEYTGTELKCKESISSKDLEKMCKEMQKVFGYGQFDKNVVKEQLSGHRQFRI